MQNDSPKSFGVLLSLMGIALAGAGLYGRFLSGSIDTYFIVIGLGYVISGILLFRGQFLGVLISNLTLLVVWVWSLKDFGFSTYLINSVGMPSILGAYINFSSIRSRLATESETPVNLNQKLNLREIAVIDKTTDVALGGFYWMVSTFIAVILFFAAKDAILTLNSLTSMIPTAGGVGRTIWILTPFFLLTGTLITGRMFSVGYLFAVSIFTSLFSMGVYGLAPSSHAVESDANIFVWVPLAQLLWIFGCYYALRKR